MRAFLIVVSLFFVPFSTRRFRACVGTATRLTLCVNPCCSPTGSDALPLSHVLLCAVRCVLVSQAHRVCRMGYPPFLSTASSCFHGDTNDASPELSRKKHHQPGVTDRGSAAFRVPSRSQEVVNRYSIDLVLAINKANLLTVVVQAWRDPIRDRRNIWPIL